MRGFLVAPACDRAFAARLFAAAGAGFFVARGVADRGFDAFAREVAARGFDVFARGFVAVRAFVFLVAMVSSFESVPVVVRTAGACEGRPRGW
jgi:hypothetical protein